ncbi:MAG: substrate-binding domain-containing protein, partial [Gemmataceae bacterium]
MHASHNNPSRRATLGSMAVVAWGATVSLTGCGSQPGPAARRDKSAKPKIALVMKSLANEFFGTMAEGAKKHQAANAGKYELIVNGIPDERDVTRQSALVAEMVAQGVDAIVIAPADSKALATPLKRAADQGVRIVNIDNKLDAEVLDKLKLKIPFVGPDNRAGAQKVGEYLADKLAPGSEVAILEGVVTSFNSQQRRDGFGKAIFQSRLKLVKTQSAQWETGPANQVTASLFGHVGHGQLHIRPFLDLSDPEHIRRMQHLARDLYQEVLEVGGTISGEHADGLSRTWFLREQYGPLYPVFVQVKRIFDPQNILNPGKIVDEGGQGLTQNLRPLSRASGELDETADAGDPDAIGHAVGQAAGAGAETPPLFPLELAWSEQELMETARDCNGCGGCRSTAPGERMCPIFRVEPTEETTPRAKANLMRAVLTGRLDANLLKTDAFKQLADLCVNCHQCRLECPASVDIPRLMTECKGQYVATNGLSRADWFLTRLDRVAAWASLVRPFANGLLASPV